MCSERLYLSCQDKWLSARARRSQGARQLQMAATIRLLSAGYFLAGQSETSARISNSKSPNEGTLWLVLKWEALQPLSQYPFAQQSGGGLFGNNNGAALRSRCTMVR